MKAPLINEVAEEKEMTKATDIPQKKYRIKRVIEASLFFFIVITIGSGIFMLLEKDEEIVMRRDFIELMATVKIRLNDTALYERVVAHAGDPKKKYHDYNDYSRVWMFAFTVVTTIGFGVQTTPHTAAGQLFCVIYSLIGIPAAGICLSRLAQFAIDFLSSYLSKSKDTIESAFDQFDLDHSGTLDMHEIRLALHEIKIDMTDYQFFDFMRAVDDGDGKMTRAEFRSACYELHLDFEEIAARKKRLVATFAFLILWVLIGTIFFYFFEGQNLQGCTIDGIVTVDDACKGWSAIESLYFVFTALTTVGFGDLFPVTRVSQVFLIFFCMVGLGLLSMIITLFQQWMTDLAKQTKEALDFELEKKATSIENGTPINVENMSRYRRTNTLA